MSTVLMFFIGIAMATPRTEIESFVDNRDGTSTLTIVCPNGKKLLIEVEKKRLDRMDVDAVYAFIRFQCKEEGRSL